MSNQEQVLQNMSMPSAQEIDKRKNKQSQRSFGMGRVHHQKRQYNEAIDHYSQAIIHDPGMYKAYCNIGSCYKQKRQYYKALEYYNLALERNSQDSKTNYNLANLYRMIGDNEKAIEHYQRALKHADKYDINKQDIQINLGITHQLEYNYNKAIQCYNKVLALKQDEAASYNKAVCYIMLCKNRQLFLAGRNIVRQMRLNQASKILQSLVCKFNHNFKAKIKLLVCQSYSNLHDHQILKSILIKYQDIKTQIANTDLGGELTRMIQEETQFINQIIATKTKKNRKNPNKQPSNTQSRLNAGQKANSQQQQDSEQEENEESEEQKPPKQIVVQPDKVLEQKVVGQSPASEQRIVQLCSEGNTNEAHALIASLPPSKQKSSCQILLYSKLGELYPQKYDYLAINIYKTDIAPERKLTKVALNDCSLTVHQAIGKCLQRYGNIIAANLHFNVQQENEKMIMRNNLIQEYKKSLQINPDDYELMRKLGILYYDNEQNQQAHNYLSLCNKAIMKEAQPNNRWIIIETRILMCFCTLDFNEYFECYNFLREIEDLQACLQGKPLTLDYLIEFYITICKICRREIASQIQQEQQLQMQKRLCQSLSKLSHISRNPDDRKEAILQLGSIYLKDAQYLNALLIYELIGVKDYQVCNALGLCYFHLNSPEFSIRMFQAARKSRQDEGIIHINLGIAYWVFAFDSGIKPDRRVFPQLWSIYPPNELSRKTRFQFGNSLYKRLNILINRRINESGFENICIKLDELTSFSSMLFQDIIPQLLSWETNRFETLKRYIDQQIKNNLVGEIQKQEISQVSEMENFEQLRKWWLRYEGYCNQETMCMAAIGNYLRNRKATTQEISKWAIQEKKTVSVKLLQFSPQILFLNKQPFRVYISSLLQSYRTIEDNFVQTYDQVSNLYYDDRYFVQPIKFQVQIPIAVPNNYELPLQNKVWLLKYMRIIGSALGDNLKADNGHEFMKNALALMQKKQDVNIASPFASVQLKFESLELWRQFAKYLKLPQSNQQMEMVRVQYDKLLIIPKLAEDQSEVFDSIAHLYLSSQHPSALANAQANELGLSV